MRGYFCTKPCYDHTLAFQFHTHRYIPGVHPQADPAKFDQLFCQFPIREALEFRVTHTNRVLPRCAVKIRPVFVSHTGAEQGLSSFENGLFQYSIGKFCLFVCNRGYTYYSIMAGSRQGS